MGRKRPVWVNAGGKRKSKAVKSNDNDNITNTPPSVEPGNSNISANELIKVESNEEPQPSIISIKVPYARPLAKTYLTDCDKAGTMIENILLRVPMLKVFQICHFVTFGYLDLPHFPVFMVENYGALPLPISECIFKDILTKKISQSFSGIEVSNKSFNDILYKSISESILPTLGVPKSTAYYRPKTALHIIGPEETFGSENLHTESYQEKRKPFVTILIQLPSVFTGGDSIVSYGDMPKIFSTSKQGESISYIAFYSSCSHTQKNITSGYQTVLEVSLFNLHEGPSPGPNIYGSYVLSLAFFVELFFGPSGSSRERSSRERKKKDDKLSVRLDGKMLCLPFDEGLSVTDKGSYTHQPQNAVTSMIVNALDYNKVHSDRPLKLDLYRVTVIKTVTIIHRGSTLLSQDSSESYSMKDFQLLYGGLDGTGETKNLVLNLEKHVISKNDFKIHNKWSVLEGTTNRSIYKRSVLLLVRV